MIFGKAQRGTRRRVRLLSSRWRSRRLLQGRPQSLHRCWFSKMARLVEMLEIILLRYYLFVSIYAFFCLAQTVCPVLGAHDHPTPAHMQRFSLVLCSICLAHNLCSRSCFSPDVHLQCAVLCEVLIRGPSTSNIQHV